MTIGLGNWQEAHEPIAIKNFALGYKEKPMERDMLFTVRKTTKLRETYLEIGDIGPMGKKNGDIEFEDVSQGHSFFIEQEEYAKGIKIEHKFILTDQLHIVEDLPRLLGLAARRRQRIDIFRMYNEGFSAAYKTIDGLPLFSDEHVNHANQGGGTWGNLSTGAFAEAEVEAVRILLKKRVSNSDALIELSPDLLVVPRELESAAYELIKSSGKVDTANNNANFHKGKYKVLVSDDLDDPDNWFMQDSEMAKMFNAWNVVAPLQFGQAENWDGMDAKYRVYEFRGYGTREARPMHGSEVN
jgi:phage major head subunit gpT-like protein